MYFYEYLYSFIFMLKIEGSSSIYTALFTVKDIFPPSPLLVPHVACWQQPLLLLLKHKRNFICWLFHLYLSSSTALKSKREKSCDQNLLFSDVTRVRDLPQWLHISENYEQMKKKLGVCYCVNINCIFLGFCVSWQNLSKICVQSRNFTWKPF